MCESVVKQRAGPGRVLLVEDHPGLARLLSAALRSEGYDVHTAGSVSGAKELADAAPFDVVVSDLGLPDGSGLDLMRDLRSRFPIRGIAYSGYGEEDHVHASRAAGFEEHLTKPVEVEQLQAAVARVLNHQPGN